MYIIIGRRTCPDLCISENLVLDTVVKRYATKYEVCEREYSMFGTGDDIQLIWLISSTASIPAAGPNRTHPPQPDLGGGLRSRDGHLKETRYFSVLAVRQTD